MGARGPVVSYRRMAMVLMCGLVGMTVWHWYTSTSEVSAGRRGASRPLTRAPRGRIFVAADDARPQPGQRFYRFNESCPYWQYRDVGGVWRPWPTHIEHTAAHKGYKGAFIYLARHKNLANMYQSLRYLDENYNKQFRADVLVFHDDLTLEDQLSLQHATRHSSLRFLEVNFCVPPVVKRSAVPRYISSSPINYRHMMRFFALKLFYHPALRDYAYFARHDTDSFLLSPAPCDVFRAMAARRWKYAFSMLWMDSQQFVQGLSPVVHGFLDKEGIRPGGALWSTLHGERYQGLQFWNNFEVVSLAWATSPAYLRLAKAVDASGLMYTRRVGDAPIRSLAVAALLDPDEVHELHDIGYQHQGYFRCPLDPAGALGAESKCAYNNSLAIMGPKCHKKAVDAAGRKFCVMQRRNPCDKDRLVYGDALCKHFEGRRGTPTCA